MKKTIEAIISAYEAGDRTGVFPVKSKNTVFTFPIIYCRVPRRLRPHVEMRQICEEIGIDYRFCQAIVNKPMPPVEKYVFELSDGRVCHVSGFSILDKNKQFEHRIRVEVGE